MIGIGIGLIISSCLFYIPYTVMKNNENREKQIETYVNNNNDTLVQDELQNILNNENSNEQFLTETNTERDTETNEEINTDVNVEDNNIQTNEATIPEGFQEMINEQPTTEPLEPEDGFVPIPVPEDIIEEPLEEEDNVEVEEQYEEQDEDTEEIEYVRFRISEGWSSGIIVDNLYSSGLIDDKKAFDDFLTEKNAKTKLRYGVFNIPKDSSYQEVVNILLNVN